MFLSEVSLKNSILSKWLTKSIVDTYIKVNKNFPELFGENWKQTMNSYSQPQRTVLLKYVFNNMLISNISKIKGMTEICEYTGNKIFLFGEELLIKLTFIKDGTVFANGCYHFNDKLYSKVLSVNLCQNLDWEVKSIFACFIDMAAKSLCDLNERTKWHRDVTNNVGYTPLKIAVEDKDLIFVIIGSVSATKYYIKISRKEQS